MDDRVIELEFSLEGANFDNAGEASSKIKRVLQQIGVNSDTIRRTAIGCYEAEMNVIIHATRGKITAHIHPDRTEVMIKDEGPGIPDIDLAMQEGYSTASDEVRNMGFGAGMGLPNISQCADEFKIDSAVGVGTTINLTIRHN